MQSNKTPKKTRKSADETAVTLPETIVPSETTAKPRASKSSKAKSETGETATVKMHRKATSIPTQTEIAPAKKETPALAMGAAVGSSVNQAMAPNPQDAAPSSLVTPDRIAELAYSYWAARGGNDGSPEEDWLRAERELRLGR